MKSIFSLLFVLMLFIAASVPPAPVTVKIGEKITSAGSSEVELQFAKVRGGPYQTVYVLVDAANSGTIQFSVGEAVGAGQQPYAAGSKLVLTIQNGITSGNLRYKASAASQSFSVTQ